MQAQSGTTGDLQAFKREGEAKQKYYQFWGIKFASTPNSCELLTHDFLIYYHVSYLGNLALVRKMLSSFFSMVHPLYFVPSVAFPESFNSTLYFLTPVIADTSACFFFSSASWFCSLIIWIADCQCISKEIKNSSLSSSSLLLVLCCAAALLCQSLQFHCPVLQPLLSAHGLHHFFSLAWLPSFFCFSKTLYYIFPHHLWSLTHFTPLFWTRWVELK